MPLLPFEKQLIDTLGITEDEYTQFVLEAIKRSGIRPAEYENIPEVYAALVPVVAVAVAASTKTTVLIAAAVNIAVGLALSAISYLLTPKPKNDSITASSQTLASISGSDRFTPTSGFDTQAKLADYAEPIPIIFGKWTGTTGGILVTPKLVWSRLFSYGTQQGAKLLFVVGEQGYDAGQKPQGLDEPDLEGIFLGNGALDSVYNNLFAFYWKRNTTISGFNRVKAINLVYGTRGNLATGDPESFDDIFSCPTAISENDYGFSSAQSLSNNADFGCYAPIANGTTYRVNWAVVSLFGEDTGYNNLYERIKIAGDYGEVALGGDYYGRIRARGMEGTGRNYSRRMGLTHLNNVSVSDSVGTEERYVNVNDVAKFTISGAQLPVNLYTSDNRNVTIDDINTTLNEERNAADDALQIGDLFMIGSTTWQVISRSIPIWRKEDNKDQVIELKCIDINSPAVNKIGFVSSYMLTADVLYDGSTNVVTKYAAGTAFYPLMKVSTGTVRNIRPCEVTEIGLRSNVYQRFNGLCNFQSVPTPYEVTAFDDANVQITTGQINAYGSRTSAFNIYIRPSGVDASGNAYTWELINETFVVTGNQPVDQYNFIRIQHPQVGRYEFKFVPKNGAVLGRIAKDTDQFWQISAASSSNAVNSWLSQTYKTVYGTFKIFSTGNRVLKTDIKRNAELTANPSLTPRVLRTDFPSSVGIYTLLPDEEADSATLTSTDFIDWYTEPTYNYTEGRSSSWGWELFGSADTDPTPINGTTTKSIRHDLAYTFFPYEALWYEVTYTIQKQSLATNHWSGQKNSWTILSEVVTSSSTNWNTNSEYIITRTVSGSNPFRTPSKGSDKSAPDINVVGQKRRVTVVSTTNAASGRAQGWYEELFGPARNYSTGTTRTATITYSDSILNDRGYVDRNIKLTLTATVLNQSNVQFNVSKTWAPPTIIVSTDAADTSITWNTGDTFDNLLTVSSTNPFRVAGTSIGAQFIIEGLTEVIDRDEVYDAGRDFEEQSQYADVTFYGNSIEKSNSTSPEHTISYVNEIISNDPIPQYDRMTLAGLSLKASRNFTSLDQIRLWLPNGIPVKRFHPDDQSTPVAPSNLFCDLVFYLLTDQVAGVGKQLNMTADTPTLINTADFVNTALFLRANKLYFDGAVSTAINLRQFISTTAPYMLCNFVISDGQFSIQPALPTTSTGTISTAPVKIKQLFTSGNILENTYQLEYLPAEERKDFQAVIRFRAETKNQLPEEVNIAVRWNEAGSDDDPLEQYDLTQFCTSRDHAELVARFLLSIRRRVTHSIKFSTTPFGISLAPGDYIRVFTESSPYSSAKNGTIDNIGNITSATTFTDGKYTVLYYRAGKDEVLESAMTIINGKVQESILFDTLFTIKDTTVSQNIYMVEQLTLTEDSTVEITATEFPCDASGSSLVAKDVLTPSSFVVDN
jgi:hypothetical protein